MHKWLYRLSAVLIIFSAIYWFVYTVAHNGRDHNDPIGSAVLFFAALAVFVKACVMENSGVSIVRADKLIFDNLKDKPTYKKFIKAAGLVQNFNKKEKAEKLLNELKAECKSEEELAALYYLTGELHYIKNTDLAIEAYEQALFYASAKSWIRIRLTGLYNEKKQYDLARKCCREAVKDSSKDYLINLHAASEFLECKAWKDALDCAMFVRAIDPEESEAVYVAAVAHKMLGNHADSERYCDKYAEMGEDAEELKEIIEEYIEKNKEC